MLKVILMFSLLFSGCAHTQTTFLPSKGKSMWQSAQRKVAFRQHESALRELEKIVSKYPDFIPGRRQLAESYLYTGRYQQASGIIEKTIQKYTPKDKKWWALSSKAFEELRKYPEAIQSLKKLYGWPGLEVSYKKSIEEQIAHLEFVHYMRTNPVPYNPISIGDEVNSSTFELYPYLSPEGDKIYFTRKDIREDLFVAEKTNSTWTNVQPLPFNSNENEGAQTISSDGNFILFTACNRAGGMGSCDIFYTIKQNGAWLEPKSMGPPVNTEEWESQPHITGNGMAIIFSSNRAGGQGGKDLYVSYRNKENQWMMPQNLGSIINTPGDEETPFLHPDGRTLFFSSNGHRGMGEKDLFMSRMSDDGVWSEPINLGYPINTERDESGLYIALDGKTAFISSSREGGQGNLDIYEFELPKDVRANPATYVKAIIKDSQTDDRLDAVYSIFEFENNHLFAFGETVQQGEFLITMPIDKTFRLEIEKKGYVFHSEQFKAQEGSISKPYLLEVRLQPVNKGSSIVLQNVLFRTNSYELEEVSFPELMKVVELMKSEPEISARIKGHTDDVGSAEYNLSLSEKRAQSVLEFLIENGISRNRLSAEGYGETQPLVPNDSDGNRQMNRRTEFEIIGD